MTFQYIEITCMSGPELVEVLVKKRNEGFELVFVVVKGRGRYLTRFRRRIEIDPQGDIITQDVPVLTR